MALIITSTACGLLAFLAGLGLQFQLPFWRSLAGLDRTSAEKYANIDTPRLRRRLSILMYVLSAGLLGGALLLYVKAVNEPLVIPFFLLLVLAVFDGVVLVYRKFDKNVYSDAARRSFRLFIATVHCVFALLVFLFIR